MGKGVKTGNGGNTQKEVPNTSNVFDCYFNHEQYETEIQLLKANKVFNGFKTHQNGSKNSHQFQENTDEYKRKTGIVCAH